MMQRLQPTPGESFDNQMRTLVLSLSGGGTATAWLTANPKQGPDSRIAAGAFVSAGQVFLGYNLFPDAQPGVTCQLCHQPTDSSAQHALRCGRSAMRTFRHNRARNVIFRFLRKLLSSHPRGAVRLEPAVEALGFTRREAAGDKAHRGDIGVFLDDGWYVIDVTIRQADRTSGTDSEGGATATAGYEAKKKFYTDRFNIPAQRVWPLAFDSYGRAAQQTKQHLQQLVSAATGDDKQAYSFQISQLYAALSTAIVVGNHAMLEAYRGTGAPRHAANAW
jgi:hypothetical protein